jgi:hypothetical protein
MLNVSKDIFLIPSNALAQDSSGGLRIQAGPQAGLKASPWRGVILTIHDCHPELVEGHDCHLCYAKSATSYQYVLTGLRPALVFWVYTLQNIYLQSCKLCRALFLFTSCPPHTDTRKIVPIRNRRVLPWQRHRREERSLRSRNCA